MHKFQQKLRVPGKELSTFTGQERRPSFPGSGGNRASLHRLPLLPDARTQGWGPALGAGALHLELAVTQSRASTCPKVEPPLPLLCALEAGPGDCPGGFERCEGLGWGREEGVCSAIHSPESFLTPWLSLAPYSTASPGPSVLTPTHTLPDFCAVPATLLDLCKWSLCQLCTLHCPVLELLVSCQDHLT